MTGKPWAADEVDFLRQNKGEQTSRQMAKHLKRSIKAIESKLHSIGATIPPSMQRRYEDAPILEGSWLVLPDVEVPYQSSEFVNKCLEVTNRKGVSNILLAGDFVHFATFSAWGKEFESARVPEALQKFIDQLPADQRKTGVELIQNLSVKPPDELSEARRVVKAFEQIGARMVYIMGNHEYRYVRATEQGDPLDILRVLDADQGKWEISQYYYATIKSGGRTWRISHPKASGANTARELAAQYRCDFAMGHSHRWALQRDASGINWAVQMGHCVDESRLSYVMARDAKRDAHNLGALLIIDGFPILLHEETPFDKI